MTNIYIIFGRVALIPFAGSARNPCLDAFAVALSQTCEGDRWYTSTKELQLASLDFCHACRSVTTLSLTVNDAIPRRLLAAADAPLPNRKRLCPSRVPRLRARRVWWGLPTAAELRKPTFSLADATEMYFDDDFADSLDGIAWPHRLKDVSFTGHSKFNRPLDKVTWPACLQKLTFGEGFNQPIRGNVWPSSLQELTFGTDFDTSGDETEWPTNLLRLRLVFRFNHPISGVVWPASLRELVLGNSFDRPIEDVAWPDSISHLTFGKAFNKPVERVTWPAALDDLSFGELYDDFQGGSLMLSAFNQAVGQASWPTSLRRLTLGHDFRRSLMGLGAWMPNLEDLCLLPGKNAVYRTLLNGIEWPSRLRTLTVYRSSSMKGVGIPQGVQVIYRTKGR